MTSSQLGSSLVLFLDFFDAVEDEDDDAEFGELVCDMLKSVLMLSTSDRCRLGSGRG